MIRITSQMPHGLKVPFLTPRGVAPKFFEIPAKEGGKPGVVELPELDSITLNRLTHHYDHRPVDMKEPNGEQHQIGLLKIEVLDQDSITNTTGPSAPMASSPRGTIAADSSLEPPRREPRPAAAHRAPAKPAKPKPAKAARAS